MTYLWHKCKYLPNPKWFLPIVIALMLVGAICCMAYGQEYTDEQIVNAIYLAEGGAKAKVPYGILSVKVADEAEARRVCFNSVRNGRKRWIKAGKPYDLITFIGMRYCPPKAHPLNSNWVKNVIYFLEKN